MINRKSVRVSQPIVISKQCDKCKKSYSAEGDGVLETQEFHHIRFTGGYGSVFGDETTVQCDICQHCLHKMIHKYMTTMNVM